MVLRSLRKKVTRLEKEGGKHEEEEEVSQTEGRKNEVISQKVTARITTVQTRDINLQRFFSVLHYLRHNDVLSSFESKQYRIQCYKSVTITDGIQVTCQQVLSRSI